MPTVSWTMTQPPDGEMAGSEKFYRQMNESADPAMLGDATNSGGSIGMVGGTAAHGSPLDFLERTALDAQVSSDQIRSLAAKAKNQAAYPRASSPTTSSSSPG